MPKSEREAGVTLAVGRTRELVASTSLGEATRFARIVSNTVAKVLAAVSAGRDRDRSPLVRPEVFLNIVGAALRATVLAGLHSSRH